MKKKKLFYIVVLVLLVAIALVATACNGKTYYKVTLEYETSQGTISLEPSPKSGKYAEGTQVTVSVVPNEGFEVDSFTVSGYDDAALNGGGIHLRLKQIRL